MSLKCLTARIGTLDTRTAKPPPKQADAHYLTPEHQAWRAEVIRRANGRCQHIDDRGKRCFKTVPHVRLFADHIVEIKDGGARLDVNNGQALCGSHHTLKTAAERRRRQQTDPHEV